MNQTLFFGSAIETTLRDRTNSFDKHPLWASSCLISEPQILTDAYRDFLKAGVDILLTNTYQASLEGFRNHFGLAEVEARDLFKKAASYCREAIKIEKTQGTVDKNKEILIFASLGSFGAHLADGSEYTGEYLQKYDIDHIRKFQREQIQVRSDAGVDGLFLATIPTSQEAFMMADLLKEFPHLKALLTFSCKNDSDLCGGEKFDEVAIKCWSLNPSQILAVGVNCSPPSSIDRLISPLKEAKIPICAITLTDKLWDEDLKQWKPSDDDHLFFVSKWRNMGVKYIGGGCESSYKTIQEIGKNIKSSEPVAV